MIKLLKLTQESTKKHGTSRLTPILGTKLFIPEIKLFAYETTLDISGVMASDFVMFKEPFRRMHPRETATWNRLPWYSDMDSVKSRPWKVIDSDPENHASSVFYLQDVFGQREEAYFCKDDFDIVFLEFPDGTPFTFQ